MEHGKFIGACDAVAAAALTVLAASAVALHASAPSYPMFAGQIFNPYRHVLGLSLGAWSRMEAPAIVIGGVALLPNLFFLAKMPRLRGGVGVAAALILLMLGVNRFLLSQPPSVQPAPTVPSQDVTGQTFLNAWNLEKLERIAGVPESVMRSKLGIPDNASSVVPLADLQSKYHFTVDQVERAISEYNMGRRSPAALPSGKKRP